MNDHDIRFAEVLKQITDRLDKLEGLPAPTPKRLPYPGKGWRLVGDNEDKLVGDEVLDDGFWVTPKPHHCDGSGCFRRRVAEVTPAKVQTEPNSKMDFRWYDTATELPHYPCVGANAMQINVFANPAFRVDPREYPRWCPLPPMRVKAEPQPDHCEEAYGKYEMTRPTGATSARQAWRAAWAARGQHEFATQPVTE